MTGEAIHFADFVVGKVMGQVETPISDEKVKAWTELYPWDAEKGGEAPWSMATALMMEAYLKVVAPRPPGNLHVNQVMRIEDTAMIGEAVTIEIMCLAKHVKGVRRVVELQATGLGADRRRLFDGLITLYWAA
ncbi:hypothetical protein [Sphingobium lactosutens]|uniref:hypothetical protein n=1 Tax=Sphingobium lactosutens TaxID=522773 RepID=UPI0015BAB625|nr:hypothetical protein [Sphingobium lactosutens]